MIFLEKMHHENWKTCPRTQLLVTKTSTCVLIQKHISVTCRGYNPSYPFFEAIHRDLQIYSIDNDWLSGPPCRDFEQTSSDFPPQHLGLLLDILGELIVLPQPDLQSIFASEKGWNRWRKHEKTARNSSQLSDVHSAPPPKKKGQRDTVNLWWDFWRGSAVFLQGDFFFGGFKGDSWISSVGISQKIHPLTQSKPNRGGHSPPFGYRHNGWKPLKTTH